MQEINVKRVKVTVLSVPGNAIQRKKFVTQIKTFYEAMFQPFISLGPQPIQRLNATTNLVKKLYSVEWFLSGNQMLLRVRGSCCKPNPCHKDSFKDKINGSFCLQPFMITHDFHCSKVIYSLQKYSKGFIQLILLNNTRIST